MKEEKILIVDDSTEILEKNGELLTQVGYKVVPLPYWKREPSTWYSWISTCLA